MVHQWRNYCRKINPTAIPPFTHDQEYYWKLNGISQIIKMLLLKWIREWAFLINALLLLKGFSVTLWNYISIASIIFFMSALAKTSTRPLPTLPQTSSSSFTVIESFSNLSTLSYSTFLISPTLLHFPTPSTLQVKIIFYAGCSNAFCNEN